MSVLKRNYLRWVRTLGVVIKKKKAFDALKGLLVVTESRLDLYSFDNL